MNIEKTIQILDALASGCSPNTGEIIENDSVLNDREVIRALERAIAVLEDRLVCGQNVGNKSNKESSLIPTEEIHYAIKLFQDNNYRPSHARLTRFFIGQKFFPITELNSDSLYGKYRTSADKVELKVFISSFLLDNGYTLHGKLKSMKKNEVPQDDLFFKAPIYNNLSEEERISLFNDINKLEILKSEDLSLQVINARESYPRAYEPWTKEESSLLENALKYTNDLEFLSGCFKRSKNSIQKMSNNYLT